MRLVEIPVIEIPMRGESVPLHDAVRWSGRASELRITRDSADETARVWRVALPENGTVVVVPRPPSAVDVESVLGTVPLVGRLWNYPDPADGWELIAGSRFFEILP